MTISATQLRRAFPFFLILATLLAPALANAQAAHTGGPFSLSLTEVRLASNEGDAICPK